MIASAQICLGSNILTSETLARTVLTSSGPGAIPLPRGSWVVSASEVTFGAAANAIDGNTSTFWSTNGTFPAWFVIDMGSAKTFDTVTVLPRQDGNLDFPGSIEIYVSDDGSTWGTAIYTASGLPNNATQKIFGPFSGGAVTHRWVKYNILSQASGARIYQGAAEINVGTYSSNVPTSYGISHAGDGRKLLYGSPAPVVGGGGPVPVAQDLAGGVIGTAYSNTITAQGGTSPYSFSTGTLSIVSSSRPNQFRPNQFRPNSVRSSFTGGGLPPGLSMSSGGLITGTPTATGTFNFTTTVTDANSQNGSQLFQIIIAAPATGGSGNYGYVA
jgi:hypothetical protein